jgi:hypothetical protein
MPQIIYGFTSLDFIDFFSIKTKILFINLDSFSL